MHAALTNYRRQVVRLIHNRNFLVVEAGKSEIKVLADFVSGEIPPPGSHTAVFLLRVLTWGEEEGEAVS